MCMMLAGNESQEDNLLILFAASRSVTSAMAKPKARQAGLCGDVQ